MSGGANPVTMGMQAAAQVIGAIGQHDQLNAAAKADRENARRTELQGAFDAMALQRRERAASGEALAAQGGAGLAVGTGSAFDLLYSNAIERERGVLDARYAAAGKADALRTQAKAEKRAATMALIGGALGAGAKVLSAFDEAKARGNYAKQTQMLMTQMGPRMPVPSRGQVFNGDKFTLSPYPGRL